MGFKKTAHNAKICPFSDSRKRIPEKKKQHPECISLTHVHTVKQVQITNKKTKLEVSGNNESTSQGC